MRIYIVIEKLDKKFPNYNLYKNKTLNYNYTKSCN